MAIDLPPRERRRLTVLGAACALCYLVGYPLALIGGIGLGWLLVWAGGLLMLAVGVLLVRLMAASSAASNAASNPASNAASPPAPGSGPGAPQEHGGASASGESSGPSQPAQPS